MKRCSVVYLASGKRFRLCNNHFSRVEKTTMMIAPVLFCLALQTPAAAHQHIWWVGQEVVIKDDYPLKINSTLGL